ncbi:MAG: hypothetical protein FWC26_08740 [Fibromonadales bacterium]|nr:hypothetical protein [Fibromonadales bacterium]
MRKFKSSILKILIIGGIGVLTFSCMSDIDIPPKTYAEFAELHGLSSSLLLSSSSSVGVSSSSSEEVEASSSSVELSSSSNEEVSSSSSEILSSSSVEPSSSSEEASSSSIEASSSSVTQSSSSINWAKCGSRSEEFDPNLYRCESGDIIFLRTAVSYGKDSYNAVLIGTQTWMAKNLNYYANGSKCYNEDENNCTKYGHLYDWATAMALPADCNTSTCTSQIQFPHRGICPEGWHIPSNSDWGTLMTAVGGEAEAGGKLKTTNLWITGGTSISGTDNYGFSALPGGDVGLDDKFGSIGFVGFWWSVREYNASSAYSRYMDYSINSAYSYEIDKRQLHSLRCLKDQ